VGKKPKSTREQFEELKARVTELEEAVARFEAAARAFVVVYAIPRVATPGEGADEVHTT